VSHWTHQHKLCHIGLINTNCVTFDSSTQIVSHLTHQHKLYHFGLIDTNCVTFDSSTQIVSHLTHQHKLCHFGLINTNLSHITNYSYFWRTQITLTLHRSFQILCFLYPVSPSFFLFPISFPTSSKNIWTVGPQTLQDQAHLK
jgi:S-methylmethionine-dependent homocysteine/selenocysteine methylase